jgi:hypothetical protein
MSRPGLHPPGFIADILGYTGPFRTPPDLIEARPGAA